MGTLFSALDIGRSGLAAAQVQLDITGNNIANVNTPGFSRRRAELAERFPAIMPYGQIGRGVGVIRIDRIRDEFLDTSYLRQVPGLGSATVQAQYFNWIQDTFLEPGENGFGTKLNDYFDALNDFSNNVESLPVREAFISEARAMAQDLNELVSRFDQIRTNANEELRNLVPQVNSLARQIANLNEQIRNQQASGQPANDLLDRRRVILDELGQIVNISTQEAGNGQLQVQIGADVLVDAAGAHEIAAVRNPALDPERSDLVEIRFVEDNSLVDIRDGQMHGALVIRDEVLPSLDARIDEIAATLIREMNRIHSQGNGIDNLSGMRTNSNVVDAATDPLMATGLPFPITPGTFDLIVYDSAGNPTTTTITITAATTLNDLANDLNVVADFSASVSGNTLNFGTATPFTFSFANDSSGALVALGMNGFFTGEDARSIAVSQDIIDNPNQMTSGYSSNPLDTGDNSAALAMAALRNRRLLDTGSATFGEFYQGTIAQLGVEAQSNADALEVESQVIQDLERRRQEISGVNLDEEVTSLILFQRAYEASARVITVADRMLEVLLATGA